MASLDKDDNVFSRLPEDVIAKIFSQELDLPARSCKACHKKELQPSELMQCPGCETAQLRVDTTFYCNIECQTRDWPNHHPNCLGVPENALENSEKAILSILVDRRLRFWDEINGNLVTWMLRHAFFFNPNYNPWEYRFEIGLHPGNLTIQSVQFQERNNQENDSSESGHQFTYGIVLLKTDPVYSITSAKPGMQLLRPNMPQAETMCPEWLIVSAHISAYHDLNRFAVAAKLALLQSAIHAQRQHNLQLLKIFSTPPIDSDYAIKVHRLQGWLHLLRSMDLWTPMRGNGGIQAIIDEVPDNQKEI
ncbi:hypothetical protein FRC16_004015 [Serendipita sp. 398]|nr:hypothetical protein FRC16_004015 [Serendipita sp. 398]